MPNTSDLRLTFYGDDFTGSTDVMEVLEQSGIPTALFLDVPTQERVATLSGIEAIGVAGISRTMSPAQMDRDLTPILRGIRELGAPVFHYKTCSTFDSSPVRGSIGYACELVLNVFPAPVLPVVVGVPQLGRYTVFGTLFAMFHGELYRLDRHPAMSRHPATPMSEAELPRILGAQTALPVVVVDLRSLDAAEARIDGAEGIVVLDVADLAQQRRVGEALRYLTDRATPWRPQPLIGSSGIEYALAAAGTVPSGFTTRGGRERRPTLVLAGSRSPSSRAQVSVAAAAGFDVITLRPHEVVEQAPGHRAIRSRAAAAASAALRAGRHALVEFGPDEAGGVDGVQLASALGALAWAVTRSTDVERLLVAGGDTSGLVARALGIDSLRVLRQLAPGAPLCRASSADPRVDGLEVCLKGGAIGGSDFFLSVADGRDVG